MTAHPGVAQRPAYTLTKMAGTLLFQLVALNVPPEKMQVISFHPGLIYNDAWKSMDLPVPPEHFDSGETPSILCTRRKAPRIYGVS
jgi:NAD(P)-dependent dehydrogenase (short-subunit alcohol dehydrogenase family)